MTSLCPVQVLAMRPVLVLEGGGHAMPCSSENGPGKGAIK